MRVVADLLYLQHAWPSVALVKSHFVIDCL